MLTEQELLSLLSDLESDRVERTIATHDTDKFAKAICAFANDFPNHRQPGYLMVGVHDDGCPSGLQVTDQLLQNLAAIRSDGNVQPLPALTVSKHSLPKGDIAVVEVLPSDLPPVRYKGRVWLRVGPRQAIASESEERVLSERRQARHRTFDAQPCIGCDVSNLVPDLFLVTYRASALAPEIIEENQRELRAQLASLRFYDLAGDCATHAGALLFGRDPCEWMPGAYVQYVCFEGNSVASRPLDERRFSGDLLTVLRELDSFVGMRVPSRPVASSALKERREDEYPVVALRELLLNAVMHRAYEATAPIRFYWYSDRVEIQSPGGLYGEATPENFPRQTAYRNPVVAEAMKSLGYVNKYGRGVIRAQEALSKNGNPPAEFTFEATYFLATIRSRP